MITVLRRFGRWSLQDQEHAERRQEAQALGGPVGQTEYVIPAHCVETERTVEGCKFGGHWNIAMAEAAREQWHNRLQMADSTCACSDGPRPSPYRILAWTDGPGPGSVWFRVHQWLEGKFCTRYDV
jgi:hypothetical protein